MTTSAVPPALAMQGLVATFGPTRALDGASLTVAPGTIHGLIGHNGAGKSTLIKVLAGLVTPQAGTIALDGAPVVGMTPDGAETLGIAFIHQERLLAPTATIGRRCSSAGKRRAPASNLARQPAAPGRGGAGPCLSASACRRAL